MAPSGNRLTPQEAAFAKTFAETGDRRFAAQVAGYKHPQVAASKALSRADVQAEIARRQNEILFSDVLPLAVKVHKAMLADERTPAGARIKAVELAYNRTLGAQDGNQAREPHEMTGEELAKAIEQLEEEAAKRARVINGEQVSTTDPVDLFA